MSDADILSVMYQRGADGDEQCAAAAAEIARLRSIERRANPKRRTRRDSVRSRAALNPRMKVRTHGLPDHEKVKARTVIEENTGCWVWQGACCNGYGKLRRGANGKPVSCHRVMYEHFYGPIPVGSVVMHLCDNTRCVNPDHLKAGTQRENVIDMHQKGRGGRSMLAAEEVQEIRRLHASGVGMDRLSSMYDIGNYTVQSVLSGRTWSWLPPESA
jgi:hypothetical protein